MRSPILGCDDDRNLPDLMHFQDVCSLYHTLTNII
jgi:hypothetical protein